MSKSFPNHRSLTPVR